MRLMSTVDYKRTCSHAHTHLLAACRKMKNHVGSESMYSRCRLLNGCCATITERDADFIRTSIATVTLGGFEPSNISS